MGNGQCRTAPVYAVDRILREDLTGRILPFDRDAAQSFANIATAQRAAGRPISQADCQNAVVIEQAVLRLGRADDLRKKRQH
jgi:toxin FitB